jgi:ribosomal protein S18 acetylase RimI-like enzyme
MKIRKARPQESEKIVKELWLPLAKEMEETSEYNKLKQDLNLEEVVSHKTDKIEEDGSYCFLAEENNELIGLATASIKESAPVFSRGDKLKINELYVKTDYRRQGTASQLIKQLEETAEETKCETIELDVNKANQAAKELYNNQGFKTERERMIKRI